MGRRTRRTGLTGAHGHTRAHTHPHAPTHSHALTRTHTDTLAAWAVSRRVAHAAGTGSRPRSGGSVAGRPALSAWRRLATRTSPGASRGRQLGLRSAPGTRGLRASRPRWPRRRYRRRAQPRGSTRPPALPARPRGTSSQRAHLRPRSRPHVFHTRVRSVRRLARSLTHAPPQRAAARPDREPDTSPRPARLPPCTSGLRDQGRQPATCTPSRRPPRSGAAAPRDPLPTQGRGAAAPHSGRQVARSFTHVLCPTPGDPALSRTPTSGLRC